jgi:hypothetical protein
VTVHCYAIFGLMVRSQFRFGDQFPEADPADVFDVDVRLGTIPLPAGAEQGYVITGQGTFLKIPGVASFLIRAGREITIDIEEQAAERNVRLFLLGSAFGALLHQRQLLPLHANAVEIDGTVVAFCGHSGAGKSTIAAWFLDRGHRILTDDVCAIGFDSYGRAVAYPGIPRLRLWREALEASGRSPEDFEASFDGSNGRDKFDVPTKRESPLEPLPLGAIYLLAKAEEGTGEQTIVPLKGIDAVEALVSNTYRGGYLQMIGGRRAHLSTCVRVANAVSVFKAERLWGFDSFAAQAELLEAHARTASAPA